MKTRKKRLLSLLLALALSLSLLPVTARAAAEPCDVYQGDGFYITATPYKLNSTKYRLPASNGSTFAGDSQFYEGLIMVYTDLDADENYVNRQYVYELNWADRDGNIVLPEGSLKANSRVYDLSRFHHFDVSEGILAYWDGESKNGSSALYGFMDTKGNILTPCRYADNGLLGFSDGVNVVYNEVAKQKECIDTRGNVLFVLNASASKGAISVFSPYVDGLAAGGTAVVGSTGDSVYSYGFLDKQGNMVLKLFSYSKSKSGANDMWELCAAGLTDGYLVPIGATGGFSEVGSFSEGYAVCYDLRSGNQQDLNFAIIDASGNIVGTFSDARPVGNVHDGLVRVNFINNRGGSDGYGFVDVTGKVVLRDVPRNDDIGGTRWFQKDFSCGVTLDKTTVVDTKGNTVIPNNAFEGYCPKGFRDNICLAYARSNGAPYLLEIHQGAYTGPGRVYNHSQGGEVSAPSVQPQQPTQPVTPAQPAQPSGSRSAAPTNDRLTVNGVPANPTVYKIDGSNYFKIRDVAALLNGTEKQFSVGYDNALKSVTVTTGQSYAPQSGDLAGAFAGGNRTAVPSNDTVYVNGQKIDAQVYKIDGGNYFKLRDLGKALNFHVDWTQEQGMMIDTSKPYIE